MERIEAAEEIRQDRRRFFRHRGRLVRRSAARHGRSPPTRSPAGRSRRRPPCVRVQRRVRRPEADRRRRAQRRLCRGRSADGPAVMLLHGWPYDIHSYVDVAPMLASKGYRVIVPLSARLRHDAVSFERYAPATASNRWSRLDAIALMVRSQDRQGRHGGFRLGRADGRHRGGDPGRSAARPWSSVSGLSDRRSQEAGKTPLPPGAELQWWYQYYFATDRGSGAGYDKYRHDFAKLIWRIASPKWNFDDATFDPCRGIVREPGPRRHRHP